MGNILDALEPQQAEANLELLMATTSLEKVVRLRVISRELLHIFSWLTGRAENQEEFRAISATMAKLRDDLQDNQNITNEMMKTLNSISDDFRSNSDPCVFNVLLQLETLFPAEQYMGAPGGKDV